MSNTKAGATTKAMALAKSLGAGWKTYVFKDGDHVRLVPSGYRKYSSWYYRVYQGPIVIEERYRFHGPAFIAKISGGPDGTPAISRFHVWTTEKFAEPHKNPRTAVSRVVREARRRLNILTRQVEAAERAVAKGK